MSYKDLIKISPQVAKALKMNKPVVSLESTIISHGMPYPNNKKCAFEVEDILRERGVEPATIAIMHGKINIGLSHDEIQQLAREGSKARKVSRRDIPYVLAQKGLGSTTVAGTMICSALAGIDIFVTGGLGGVHRGYEQTMDVSADLRELGRTPVNVVSAGVKNILDISRTLEYLETEGVPVVTYGSKYFPAFFAPSSGIESPISFDNISEIASMLQIRKRLGLQNGVLVTVPNQDTEDAQKIQKAIQQALKEADEQKISGAATTPFLLKRVHTITEGASIRANINLVKHNAQIGAELAMQYNKKLHPHRSTFIDGNSIKAKGKLIVIGGSALDYQINIKGRFQLYQSCRGKWRTSFGGVGRNISEVAQKLGTETALITVLGQDGQSSEIRRNINENGIDLFEIQSTDEKGATFLGILDDKKDAIISISDMDINKELTLENIQEAFFRKEVERGINKDDIVVIDANIESADKNLSKILEYVNQLGYFIMYQCKGIKTSNIVVDDSYQWISLIKMNEYELQLLFATLKKKGVSIDEKNWFSWLADNVGKMAKNKEYTDVCAIVTKGEEGFNIVRRNGEVKYYKVVKSDNIVKTTGAGDTFTGTFCSMLLKGESIDKALEDSAVASKMTVESRGKDSVIVADLSLDALNKALKVSRANFI